MLATQLLVLAGAFDASDARQIAARGSLSGAAVGGALFGMGMILARGCSSRLLVLAAQGNLRSVISGLVFAVTAQAAWTGALSPLRQAISEWWTVDGGASRDLIARTGIGHGGAMLFGAVWLAAAVHWTRRQRVPVWGWAGAIGVGLTTDNEITRFNLTGVIDYTLSDHATGTRLAGGRVKSFTAYSANMAPDQIRRYLNEYFEAMVEIVFAYEGTVDKYIGDGLMVFFGDPEMQPDHAVRCVGAALAMQRKARELRRQWEQEGGLPLQIRIGINTGEVVVGNMGSRRRLSYTVLGSAVTLAVSLAFIVATITFFTFRKKASAQALAPAAPRAGADRSAL